jgi:hypothetical protein
MSQQVFSGAPSMIFLFSSPERHKKAFCDKKTLVYDDMKVS